MDTVKISVVIPVYNMEKHLRECVDSVLNQSLRAIQLILVNDGSTDASGAICDEYQRKDPRVSVLHNENGGLSVARNSGMALATGTYVTFVDSDDFINSTMYETLYARAVAEKADLCSCGWRRMKNGVEIGEDSVKEDIVARKPAELQTIYLRHLGMPPNAPSDTGRLSISSCISLFSLALIRAHSLRFKSERECLSEDTLFKTEYLRYVTCVCIIKDVFYNYRITTGSLTGTYAPNTMASLTMLYQLQLKAVAQTAFFDAAVLRIQRNILMVVRCSVKLLAVSPYHEVRETLSTICASPLLQEILSTYPWRKNPIKYRLFCFCFYHKLPRLLYGVARLANKNDLRKSQLRR